MYIIGNQSFKTQREIKQYIKEIFEKNGLGKVNQITHNFLSELIKRHPDFESKIGSGIDYFLISQNPVSRQKSYHLSFRRTDGSMDDISYNICITGKEVSNKVQTLNSMRNSIHSHIKQFKINAEQKCNKCGIIGVNFDCDHYGTEFKEISESFIKKYDVCSSFKSDGFFTCFDDDEYKDKWINYHNEKAKLQLLCVKCHISK